MPRKQKVFWAITGVVVAIVLVSMWVYAEVKAEKDREILEFCGNGQWEYLPMSQRERFARECFP